MTAIFAFAVAVLVMCGLAGSVVGWPLTGLWAGVLIVAVVVFFLGEKP